MAQNQDNDDAPFAEDSEVANDRIPPMTEIMAHAACSILLTREFMQNHVRNKSRHRQPLTTTRSNETGTAIRDALCVLKSIALQLKQKALPNHPSYARSHALLRVLREDGRYDREQLRTVGYANVCKLIACISSPYTEVYRRLWEDIHRDAWYLTHGDDYGNLPPPSHESYAKQESVLLRILRQEFADWLAFTSQGYFLTSQENALLGARMNLLEMQIRHGLRKKYSPEQCRIAHAKVCDIMHDVICAIEMAHFLEEHPACAWTLENVPNI